MTYQHDYLHPTPGDCRSYAECHAKAYGEDLYEAGRREALREAKLEPLPEHSPMPHRPGYWETETCERCRRQAAGQRNLLAYLQPTFVAAAIYKALLEEENPDKEVHS